MPRRLIAQFLVNAFALWFAAQVVDGVHFDGNLVARALMVLIVSIRRPPWRHLMERA
jgi:uncharacterized membrane protein YvlD (DUF360 family)